MNRNWIKIASIYIGTVIGAGFATGREIIEFFAIYGIRGIGGMIIASLMFSVLGSLLLIKIRKLKVKSFNELCGQIFNEKIKNIINFIILLALYSGFCIMVAASGAVFKEELGLSTNIGILFMIVLSIIVFVYDIKGLSLINEILVPIIIFGTILSCLIAISKGGFQISNTIGLTYSAKGNFISSAILYFGSNSLVLLVVFSSLLPLLNSGKSGIKASMAAGIVLGTLGMLILLSILVYYNDVHSLEIPMLKISSFLGVNYRKLYSLILWIAIFTTALANGFGFLNNISNKKNNLLRTLIFSVTVIPISKMGFANLVGVLYPIFGFIGVIMFLIVIFK